MGMVDGADQDCCRRDRTRRDRTRRDRTGPVRLPATPVVGVEAVTAACPHSGKPVTHVLKLSGRRFGFCNVFCRDTTVADPEAWPKFIALYHS